ncbi:MAG TPA: hypothetical protein VJP45_14510 [Candidatus Limnocylindria bacterium]|nr:hypothetical protein [Candidatus Limnocylindria bacterium]
MIRKVLLIALLLVGGTVATASDDIGTTAPSSSPEPVSASASPSPTPTPAVPPDSDPGVILKEFPQTGPRNQVRLENKTDGRFLSRSAISLHHSSTQNVEPMNIAIAEGRCTNCATLAIAVQVFIYPRGATSVRPQNIAIAVNNVCTGCATIAWAIQYVIPVDDPNTVPENVKVLMRDMERELRYFASVKTVAELDPAQAEARLRHFLQQDAELRQYLFEMLERAPQTAQPTSAPIAPSPSGTQSPAPTVAPSPAESATPSPSPTTP